MSLKPQSLIHGAHAESSKSGPVLSGRRLALNGIMVSMVFVAIELMSFIVIDRLRYTGVFYDPHIVKQSYADYLTKRDAILGWGPHRAAADGTRMDPAFGVRDEPCISLFGDSFTESAQVADEDAWGSVLARKISCRVANYGVGGYGSDQAYLRFRTLPPRGEIVFLNHLSENILRNVNQYRNLLYPGGEFTFKPRFVFANGAIRLIGIPQISWQQIGRFKNDPAAYLRYEYFLPGGGAGNQLVEFPYSLVLFKALFMNYHILAKIRNKPRHTDFYLREHSSQALDVTYGIMRTFAEEAGQRGQLPIVTVIPTCDDLKYFDRNGELPYANLTKKLVAEKIRLLDFGEEIAKRLAGASPESLYQECSGHFNKAGYHYLAEIAFDYLKNDRELWCGLINRGATQNDTCRGDIFSRCHAYMYCSH